MTDRQQAPHWATWQGHYAGSVSRFLAYVIDAAVSSGLFALGLAGVSLVVQVVTGHSVHWTKANIAVAIVFAAWEFCYFGYSWAASGRTFGMTVLGVRVVRADGAAIDQWRGWVRALVFPLSFLFCGLGFLGILVQREHRALHDLIAGTAVIYSWDARAARLRFLARAADLGHGPGGHDAGGHDAGGHDAGGHDAGGHDPGGHDPGGHDPGGHDPGGAAGPVPQAIASSSAAGDA